MTASTRPPLESVVPNLYPQTDGQIVFAGVAGNIIFKIIEEKTSRTVGGGACQLVYEVFLDPPRDELFTNYLDYTLYVTGENQNRTPAISDEVIIGWNVFDWAGWTFFDLSLVKQWPPACTRIEHNHYKVVIDYRPVAVVNFQLAPTKAKRKYAYRSKGWAREVDTNHFLPIDISEEPEGDEILLDAALRAIDTDINGVIQGIDVAEPTFSWTERWRWGPYDEIKYVTNSEAQEEDQTYEHYFERLAWHEATVNYQPFRGLPAGSVLFKQATGRSVGPLAYEIDYEFSHRPKRPFLDLGFEVIDVPQDELIEGPLDPQNSKSGIGFIGSSWLYVDIQDFKKGVPVTLKEKKYVIQTPGLVKMHQIYKVSNFDELQLYSYVGLSRARFMGIVEEVPHLQIQERLGARYQCQVFSIM